MAPDAVRRGHRHPAPCHCYTRVNEPSRKYEMQLRGAGRNVRVTIGELGAELASRF
jgi:hypothetical protein